MPSARAASLAAGPLAHAVAASTARIDIFKNVVRISVGAYGVS
jgi:hypothetical protein